MKLALAAFAVAAVALGLLLRPAGEVPAMPDHRMPGAALSAEGPVRIVALGTSLTAGGDWTAPLSAALSACAARPVEIVPVAMPGRGSDWGVEEMDEVIALQPDLVLIEFSINDADLAEGRSLASALADHETILDALHEAVPVLVTMSPAFGPRGWLRPRLAAHEAQYRELAEARRIGLIDLAPVWHHALAAAPDRRALMPDGLHPTSDAVAAIAFPVLRQELGKLIRGC